MLTMQGKELLKKGTIRHAEYYNMVEVLDKLYADSTEGKVFKNLISIISSDANIKMAYRNLKNNDGSNTAGVDGKRENTQLPTESGQTCIYPEAEWQAETVRYPSSYRQNCSTERPSDNGTNL